ncbi:MAG TPA: haloacid dehalogenase type II [Terriglobales bacterium]|jgi:2-haloacid dehalogenase|nr:haloacid dehalogenase type II [Terriglobales bacterium]
MLDFSRFAVLSFDCYGTMIDWETGIFSALRPILSAHNKRVNSVTLLKMYSELELEAEQQTYVSYREVLRAVVRGFGRRLGFDPSEPEMRSLPESLAGWQPFPDTVDALRELKTRYQLAVISNIDDDLFASTAPSLGVEFDQVVTAQQALCYKPCKRIFQIAQARMGVKPEQWLHVGQSIYHDVIPAQAMGMTAVWVNRPSPREGAGATKAAAGKPDAEVSSLKALADLAGLA